MPRRRFELVEGSSAKFWEIETKGTSVVVCFGRIGTKGQARTKRLATSLGARLTAEKLIAEKEAKGYVLGGKKLAPVARPTRVGGKKVRRHPLDGFVLPADVWPLLALDAYPAFLEPAWSVALAKQPSVPANALRQLGESMYDNHPFEISTYSYNGGDGLEYAWAVHAPELDREDQPMVSWAPVDSDGALLLGRTTREGLTALMVAAHLDWQSSKDDYPEPPPSKRAEWKPIVKILGRAPKLDDARVKLGGRISEQLVPDVPKGWRFEPGPDGIGVLAPSDAFGRKHFDEFRARDATDAACEEADRLLAAGAPAGALVLAKRVRRWDGDDAAIISVMRDAYRALGRTMHAQRADAWLATHGA
jgi:predicted DNA-binding WGR domain protein